MNALGKALAQIAQQLGMAAGQLWTQMVAVTFWTSVAWLVIDMVLLVGLGTLAIGTSRQIWRWIDDPPPAEQVHTEDQNAAAIGILVVIGVVYIVFAVATINSLPNVIAGIMAPEGVTAMQLFHTITGK